MININKDYCFTPDELQLKLDTLKERARAVLRMRKEDSKFVAKDLICNMALARELLKRSPLYTCIIDPELLLDPTIALYMVPSDGQPVYREAPNSGYYIGFKGSTDANNEYEKQLESNNPALYKTYMILKNIVAAADRRTAMKLVDVVVRYYRLTNDLHSLIVVLPHQFGNTLDKHLVVSSTPASYELTDPYIRWTREYLEWIANGITKDYNKAEKTRALNDILKINKA